MFTRGQWLFAIISAIVFIIAIIFSYRRDGSKQLNYFKGSYKILIGCVIGVVILFLMKYLMQSK